MRVIITLLMLIAAPIVTRSGEYVSGATTCPSSGAARVSTTSVSVAQLTVVAPTANTGEVHVGGSNVTTSTGGILLPGGSYTDNKNNAGTNPSILFFACTVSADTINWIGSR